MIVPIVFMAICVVGFFLSGLPLNFLFNEMIFRLSRNLILVMSLIIPVITGMGLNFGIVLGAMAGQIGLIFIMNYGIGGIGGFLIAILVSTPVAIILGYLVGKVLNKAKGKEMITSMILGFFANGIYQLIFIVLAGKVIPISNRNMLMPTGVGLKNTIDLNIIRKSLDGLFFKDITPYPIVTLIITALLFAALYFFLKTKLGQEMRAVGQNMHIANVSGINVDKTRIIAIMISTVLAAWGQIVYLQNMGTLNTFSNHEQVGLFAVASLLIGGASVNKASWREALIGTFLFHLLFIISPLAGQNLMGNAQIGEYFRVFIAYGVIGLALLLHAWEQNKARTQLSDI
ncbi:ABC transporter permease [Tissierella sp.]|uniref:ABC transporter permease subunit n=1 Tax=Tissierella sp. TaxID=41274 RepID=UPI003065F663